MNRKFSKAKRSRTRKGAALQEKGFGLLAIGVVFLLIPAFLGRGTMAAVMANGLKTPAWMAIVIGLVLLMIHQVVKRNPQSAETGGRPAAEFGAAYPDSVGRSAAPRRPPTTAAVPPAPAIPRRRFSEKPPRREPTGSHSPVKQAVVDTPLGEPSTTRPLTWTSAVFPAIEWRRFEAVCEALFAQAGFRTTSQTHGADGGVDIWLYSKNAEGPAAIAQCKHWNTRPVGVKEVREFFGVMASHQIKRGTFATTSTFTPDAAKFAKDNQINALDGPGLLRLIGSRTEAQQQTLLEVAFEGDYWRPTCASCGIKTVERTKAKTGGKFWGCSNYPRCKSQFPFTSALH